MTVGVVTTSFPRFAGDYAGCFVEDDVRALLASGASVDVVAAASGYPSETGPRPDLGSRVRVVRVDTRAGAARNGQPSVERPLFYGAGAPEALESGGLAIWAESVVFSLRLRQTVAELAPAWSRIVAHWLVPCAAIARLAAPRIPVLGYAHSGDVALLERIPGGAAVARWLAGSSRMKIIFVSDDLRRRFARLSGLQPHDAGEVAPAGAVARPAMPPPQSLPRAQAREALGFTGWTVLSVGRLVPIKGFDVLVRAIALANALVAVLWPPEHRALPPTTISLTILGEGPERQRLRRLAERLGVELSLPGAVPRDQVWAWLSGADLYVQPSRSLQTGRTEGTPLAAREALAAGLPVVATATGGLAELADSSCPVDVVPPADHRALAHAIVQARHRSNATRALAHRAAVASPPSPA